MFANKQNMTTNRTGASDSTNIKAFLGAGSEFEGRMTFNENMRIDGTFRGEIASQGLLVIGETGQLQAKVMVGSMVISGAFQGTIRAKSSVQLKAPAKVKGEIICPCVSIEDGVVFDGTIQMSKQAESAVDLSRSAAIETRKPAVALVDSKPDTSVDQNANSPGGQLL